MGRPKKSKKQKEKELEREQQLELAKLEQTLEVLKRRRDLNEDKDPHTEETFNYALSNAERELIRLLYCVERWRVVDICLALKKRKQAVYQFIYSRKLKKLRARLQQRILEKAYQANAKDFQETVGLSTANIKEYLSQLLSQGGPKNVKEAKLISDIGANYWRIRQNAEGKADTIKRIEHMTEQEYKKEAQEVMDLIKDDPMLELVDLEEFDPDDSTPVN